MNTNRKNSVNRMIAGILSAASLLTASAAFMPAMTAGAAECEETRVFELETLPAFPNDENEEVQPAEEAGSAFFGLHSDRDSSLNYDVTSFFIVKMPNKTEYHIGEELDLTGGTAFANGIEDGMCWDAFEEPMDYYTVDASDFDNTKPGTYTIRLICTIPRKHAEVTFTVTVLPDTAKDGGFFASKPASGDVNADGEINVMDVIAVNKYLNGAAELDADALRAADMNGDGEVNAADSLLLLKKMIS